MAKFTCLLLLVCFGMLSCTGQSIHRKTIKRLLDTNQINSQRQVVLIQNDSLLVITTDVLLYKYLKRRSKIDIYARNEYDSIVKFVAGDTINKKIVLLDQLSIHLKGMLDYITGSLLQTGKCYAYNKKTERGIQHVLIIDYSTAGTTGKQYYLNNMLLLDNTEMIF